jgi:hypothetical protein
MGKRLPESGAYYAEWRQDQFGHKSAAYRYSRSYFLGIVKECESFPNHLSAGGISVKVLLKDLRLETPAASWKCFAQDFSC